MSARLLDGKAISIEIREQLKSRVQKLYFERGIIPGLAVITTGEDDSIKAYVNNKDRICKEIGIYTENYFLPYITTQDEILEIIHDLNKRNDISGIMVQLPLAEGLDCEAILGSISPDKDVDGLTPVNRGKLHCGEKSLIPCTAKGIIRLIEYTGLDICGSHAVVVGRSNIVGSPAASLLLQKNATITICHSKTKNISVHLKDADIIVSAVGKPNLIGADMVKKGAVVIDAGTRVVDRKLTGDVKFEEVSEVASWITPVPGGVGSMTTTMLIENTVEAAECILKY